MTSPLFLIDETKDNLPLDGDQLQQGWVLELPDAVRRHALGAMRLKAGEELQLSNGKGLRIKARVLNEQDGTAEVQGFEKEPEPQIKLALIQALAKTGHDEQAIEMSTQIGVDTVIPWQADRSIARYKAGRTDRKWRQTLIAATEQSRRAWIPKLEECVNSKGIEAICRRACVHGDVVVVLHQDETNHWSNIEDAVREMMDRTLEDKRPRTVYVIVGPEGGISETEVLRFRDAGALCCVLGKNILRAATAGPVALSLLSRTTGRIL
ncbi:16S rRNA methyltransferase [Bifidobacterium dolichotidis]|uniref:Ribosomal RNA small subunit methyltransferase E n=1 Tax=Bifidobacterium dolichotidis TaxID=2306976 RepID=A0A430FSW4_9BIFI|nr:16S rRNA (uracil(1498)-N(3))-methyltransferase [Bifidobacterium dolichotidis]RSX55968.1 16S rRNA methyltransferase [Bifidobacterium dolichotidis]